MTSDLTLRDAVAADTGTISAIYAYWVLNGTGTFEELAPSAEEMLSRMQAVQRSGMPWLVACDNAGNIKGYAYASPFRPRTGYRWSVEDSVYVEPNFNGRGLGRMMLKALISRVEHQGIRQMLAVIGDHENKSSIGLHRACGFQDAGVFADVGFKFGRWLDIVLMQLTLNGGASTQPSEGTGWRP